VPSRKEIQWSQLRVGALVLVALIVLIGLIILMSGSTGGLFARKMSLRSYFQNAAGLKPGAPVTLEGVTIGNVTKVRVVPSRNPTPVEVTLQVGEEFQQDLHTDSVASIAQSGALGDSFIDVTSVKASGPPPGNNAELKAKETSNIQDVLASSETTMHEVTGLIKKIDTLVDTLNSTRGSAGEFLNDPELYRKISRTVDDLHTVSSDIANGKGSLGKLITDDTLYARANATLDRVNDITAGLDEGKGTAGKLLKDDALYNNLNATVTNANQMLAEINAGHGSFGKLAHDREFAKKLDDAVTRLDSILTGIDEGRGSIGQLMQNKSLYDHADKTMEETQQLVKSIREDPKKYLVIHMKVF
jgi:phospholipid/cholesterol/gamma-HCH transport system substrate-binding protein